MKTLSLEVTGMTCQNCVRHVTEALKEVPGVNSVDVSLEGKKATLVVGDGFAQQAAVDAVSEAGYTPGAVTGA